MLETIDNIKPLSKGCIGNRGTLTSIPYSNPVCDIVEVTKEYIKFKSI